MTAATIWIVDDEPLVRTTMNQTLTMAGFRVAECPDGMEALDRLATETPDLMILDVEMPGLDGWETLREFRARGYTQPILMFTHVNDAESRVRGLELGADDYLGKPCTVAEVLARVRAWLRRAPPKSATRTESLRFKEVMIDLDRKTATKAGEPLRLTRTDYALLALLHEHGGQPVSREVILRRVWKRTAGSPHLLDTHLWRLRRKLGDTGDEPQWIRNVSGIGFALMPPK